MSTWPIVENVTSPLGVGLMCGGNHYDPQPDHRTNYSNASTHGVGFDRTTATGSGYIGQYQPAVSSCYDDLNCVPTELLLFLHNVAYNFTLPEGDTVIERIYNTHLTGVVRVCS